MSGPSFVERIGVFSRAQSPLSEVRNPAAAICTASTLMGGIGRCSLRSWRMSTPLQGGWGLSFLLTEEHTLRPIIVEGFRGVRVL
jgi:hypothetical protein